MNNDRHPNDCRCTPCVQRRMQTRRSTPLGMMEPDLLAKLPAQPPWQWSLSYALVSLGDFLVTLREQYATRPPPAPEPAPEPAPAPGLRLVDADDPVAAELAAMEAAEAAGGDR